MKGCTSAIFPIPSSWILAMLLEEKALDLFTIFVPYGWYTPTRVPTGMVNAAAFVHSTTKAEAFRGIYPARCMVSQDDIILRGNTSSNGREREVGLAKVEASRYRCSSSQILFLRNGMKWFDRVYSGTVIPGRRRARPGYVQRLRSVRLLDAVRELLLSLQAVNWMRPRHCALRK